MNFAEFKNSVERSLNRNLTYVEILNLTQNFKNNVCHSKQEVLDKHEIVINEAVKHMENIKDSEHDIAHLLDVIEYMDKLLPSLLPRLVLNIEVCYISAYWHDVGRIEFDKNHEELSALMLEEILCKNNYAREFIQKCSDAIRYHKWNMQPKTVAGHIVKDVDKLAFIGQRRWKACLEDKKPLDEIIELLPKLNSRILHFEESKNIFNEELMNFIQLLYSKIDFNREK